MATGVQQATGFSVVKLFVFKYLFHSVQVLHGFPVARATGAAARFLMTYLLLVFPFFG